MNKSFIPIVLTLLLLAPAAFADGGMIWNPPNHDTHVYLPEQKAVIFWDGAEERLIVSTKVQTDELLDMAWIIPIPSSTKPIVEEGDLQIFYEVSELFREYPKYNRGILETDMIGASSMSGVTLVEVQEIGVYDIQMLKATDAQDLVDWLNAYNYNVPQSALPVFEHYVDMGNVYFVANRIDMENKYYGQYVEGRDDKCARALRYVDFNQNYAYYDGDSSNYEIDLIKTEMKTKDDCKGADVEVVTAILKLQKGTATPLEITFQPEDAFYPMKMSSINEGDSNVNVYVFSKDAVKDESGVMEIEKMTKIDNWQHRDKYDLSTQKYATWLTYDGDLADLDEDSVFVKTSYKSSMAPNAKTLGDYVQYIVPSLIIVGMLAGLWFILNSKVKVKQFKKEWIKWVVAGAGVLNFGIYALGGYNGFPLALFTLFYIGIGALIFSTKNAWRVVLSFVATILSFFLFYIITETTNSSGLTIGILIATAIGAAGYFVWEQYKNKQPLEKTLAICGIAVIIAVLVFLYLMGGFYDNIGSMY
ncbi:MAG: DUF2330 domain-containing protein [archaeon]